MSLSYPEEKLFCFCFFGGEDLFCFFIAGKKICRCDCQMMLELSITLLGKKIVQFLFVKLFLFFLFLFFCASFETIEITLCIGWTWFLRVETDRRIVREEKNAGESR